MTAARSFEGDRVKIASLPPAASPDLPPPPLGKRAGLLLDGRGACTDLNDLRPILLDE